MRMDLDGTGPVHIGIGGRYGGDQKKYRRKSDRQDAFDLSGMKHRIAFLWKGGAARRRDKRTDTASMTVSHCR